jgi:hypothetical protein
MDERMMDGFREIRGDIAELLARDNDRDEENVNSAMLVREASDQLDDHEKRISKLEKVTA